MSGGLLEDLEGLEARTGMRWRVRGDLDVPDAFALRTALVVSSAAAAGVTTEEPPPDLYSSAVRYQLDPKGCNPTVPWWTVLERGSGDCQDLTAWRAAERYREAGRWPVFMLEDGGRPGLIHVRLADEDPSKRLAAAGRWEAERRNPGPECSPGVWPGQRDRAEAGACGCNDPEAGQGGFGVVLELINAALGGATAAVDAGSNAKHGTGTGTGTGRTSGAAEWETLVSSFRSSSSTPASSSSTPASSSSSSSTPASSSSTPASSSSSSTSGLLAEIMGLIGAIGGAVKRDKQAEAGMVRIWSVYTWARRRGGGGRYRRYASGLSRTRADSIAANLRSRGIRAVVRGAELAPAAGGRSGWVDQNLTRWDGGEQRKVIASLLSRVDALAQRGTWSMGQVRELRAAVNVLYDALDFDAPASPVGPAATLTLGTAAPGSTPAPSGSGPLLVAPGTAPRTGINPATGKPWQTWQTIGPDGSPQTWQAGGLERAPRGAKARRSYALSLRAPAPAPARPAGASTRGYVSESFGPGGDVDDIRAAGESVVLLSRLLELYGD